MERRIVYQITYPNLNLELIYKIEQYYCQECEEYHDIEYIAVYYNNNLFYKIPISRISYERVKKELRRLYKKLRLYLRKNEVNSILGAVGNLLYFIIEKSCLPRRAVKIS